MSKQYRDMYEWVGYMSRAYKSVYSTRNLVLQEGCVEISKIHCEEFATVTRLYCSKSDLLQ